MNENETAAVVKVYTANAASYLGSRTDNVITGMSVPNRTMDSDIFADFLKAKQMKELLSIEVGQNSDVITRELTRRENLDFKLVMAEFDEAKSMSEDWLVNQVFDEFRGKKR